MKFTISFFSSETILFFAIAKVMHSAELADPCPSGLYHIVADMCTVDFVEEDILYGSKAVDSIVLRIRKHRNNCICYISLENTATNYTLYMSKYNELKNTAPEQQNCGLGVDVEYVESLDGSDITRSLQPIECTSGTSMRSVAFNGNEAHLKLTSRIIAGNFNRGYCMQIYKSQAMLTCKMHDQGHTSGLDGDWIVTYGTQHTSIDKCKQYCLQTKICVAVHYVNNYCFVYNQSTILIAQDGATYSQKRCADTQTLKIGCYPPETTTQTNQETITEDTLTTKTETVTKPISDNQMTISTRKSTIEEGEESMKNTSPSFLVALVIAVMGCTVAVIFAGTTLFYKRQLLTQKSKSTLAPSVNYVDLSVARDVSDYSAINTKVVNEQYETVNART